VRAPPTIHTRMLPDKAIVIAGDDDHKAENNPGRKKALAAAWIITAKAKMRSQCRHCGTALHHWPRENIERFSPSLQLMLV